MERVFVFIGLFTLVLFLESAGSRYIISAVQSIERQFHIPSKISSLLVSSSKIAEREGLMTSLEAHKIASVEG